MSIQNSSKRVTARARLGLLALSIFTATLLVLPEGGSAIAASKTTKKSASKAKKPTTTKRRKAPAPAKGAKRKGVLWAPNGRPPVPALNFDPNPPSGDKALPSAKNETGAYTKVQPDGKALLILILGSDARPGEKVDRLRADAIHLFAYNPTLKSGAIVAFPRDTWVEMPSGDKRKFSEVLAVGGPVTMLETFNKFTGLSVTRYAITGFDGFKKMVDGVGGVNVQIKPAMDDPASAAQFEEGWFQMNGAAALAYNRARKTLPRGDLDRSVNQNKFLLQTLARLRESTDNVRALLNWVYLGRKHIVTNIKAGDWVYYAQVSRAIDPATLKSVLIPASPQLIGDQEAVVADEAALAVLMKDVADGALGN